MVLAIAGSAWCARLVAIAAVCLIMGGCGGSRSGITPPTTPVYSIEGNKVQLVDGAFESEDGTVSLLISTSGDLDGDAVDDHATILVLDSRGSGVFYYLNVLLNDGSGLPGDAKEAFLGDRIRFDFMDIYGAGSVSRLTGVPIHAEDYGKLVVGYHIRNPDQSFAEDPKFYITRHWKIEDGELILVEDY